MNDIPVANIEGEILDHNISKIKHDTSVDISHLRCKCAFEQTFLHDSVCLEALA